MTAVTSLVVTLLALSVKTGFADESKCQTFADGSVYPSSTVESTNHKLQYTKALSERFFTVVVNDDLSYSLVLND